LLILVLGCGIGANIAIFSLLDTAILRHLPGVDHANNLVILKWATHESYFWAGCPGRLDNQAEISGCSFSYPVYERIAREQEVISGVAALIPAGLFDVTLNGSTNRSSAEFVSGAYFSTLGVKAFSGRLLTSIDEANKAAVAVLSYRYWKSQMGSDTAAIGKSIRINGVPFTIIGIAAPEFVGIEPGLPRQIWIPLSSRNLVDQRFPPMRDADGGSFWVEIVARIRTGIPSSMAKAKLTTIFDNLVVFDGASSPFRAEDEPRIELPSIERGLTTLRDEFSRPLLTLMAGVAVLLIVACANSAALLLARAFARQKLVAIRIALGANRRKIVQELITHTLLIAFAGATIGLIVGYSSARWLSALFSEGWEGLNLSGGTSSHVIIFAVGVCGLVAFASGIAPAIHATRIHPIEFLTHAGGTSPLSLSATGSHLRTLLVIVQIGLSTVALIVVGLFARTVINLETQDIGFDKHNLLLFNVDSTLTRHNESRAAELRDLLQARFSNLPGVISATYSATTLLSGTQATRSFVFPELRNKEEAEVDYLPVGPNFFKTMSIGILEGRSFEKQDVTKKPVRSALVNLAFAHHFFGTDHALGRRVAYAESRNDELEIVGIVKDCKYDSLRKQARPLVYVPMDSPGGEFVLRTSSNPMLLVPDLRKAVEQIGGNLFVVNPRTQVQQIDSQIYQERLLLWISAALGIMVVGLACMGLYALLSTEVSALTYDIGVRMVVGATRAQILGQILSRGVRLLSFGIVPGALSSILLTRFLSSFLYGIPANDPVTLFLAIIALSIISSFAILHPAYRAMTLEPAVALRRE
jgi:predicted permease